jgi:hypothetical protein
MVGCLTWFISSINARRAQNIGRQDTTDEKRNEWIANIAHLKASKKLNGSNDLTQEAIDHIHAQLERAMQTPGRSSETRSRSLEMMTVVTLFFAPLSAIVSSVSTFDLFFAMNKNASALYSHQFLLIPQSDVSMSSLDQIAALVGGVIVLLAAIRSAYRSRVDNQSAPRSIQRRQSI